MDPRQRQMSHMLFHPEIQRATNARLAAAGLALHPVSTEQGRPATLELRDLDGRSEGVHFTQTQGSQRAADGAYVGVTAWVDDKVSPLRASSVLSAVMDAEGRVHQDTKGASKPTYGVETLSLSPTATHLKGRMAAADWRQEVTYPDEAVPKAWAAKSIRLENAAELPQKDGTLVRVPAQGYLAVGTDGQAKAFPKTALFANIEGVTREHGAQDVQGLAERMVSGLKAVRAIEGAAKAQHVAVLDEPKGGASLVTELPTGEIATLRTVPSAALARQALDTYGPSYDQEAAARMRRADQNSKAQATR